MFLAVSKPSVRELAVTVLTDVLSNQSYADEAIDRALRGSGLSPVDTSLLIELVHGTTRWRGQLDWILGKFYRGDFHAAEPTLRVILELSLYQIYHLTKIPKYAAVSEGVDLAKKAGGKRWANLVNGVLRNYLRRGDQLAWPAMEKDPVHAIAVRYSHPTWMVRRWLKAFGAENTIRYCAYNNERPRISVRVNTQKANVEEVVAELDRLGFRVARSDYFNDFVRVEKAVTLTQTELFRKGFITIQDESTALSVLLLDPQEGEVIVDLCAAPGGKSGHIANLMHDRGSVLAVDVQPMRLALLAENKQRLRLKRVLPVLADARRIQLKHVDKILLDVPCSGLGVLSRRSDLRWRRTLHDIKTILTIQRDLLEHAATQLKPGGVLVYSTCTLEPEETMRVVVAFLAAHPEVVVESPAGRVAETFVSDEGYVRVLPFVHGIDGAFAVRMVKKSA